MNRRVVLASSLAALGVGAGAWWTMGRGPSDCGDRLTRADLDAAIALGGRYLIGAQQPTGDFVYEVDWTSGQLSDENNPVRQAGATWGLSLFHHETGNADARIGLHRSLDSWMAASRSNDRGTWLVYGKGKTGHLGGVALVGLAIVERLRRPEGLTVERREALVSFLDGLLGFIHAAAHPDGGWYDRYDNESGTPTGAANPYADGEVLLLFTKVGLHLDRPELVAQAVAIAERDYARHVTAPRAKTPDPDQTKGYYQWGSMSWAELAAGGQAADRHGGWLVELAVWMVDVHNTLTRTRNTAYAYEGIVPAWAWAKQHGPPDVAHKLGCAAHQGLRKLFSWQLGHPLAREDLAAAPPKYHGAVINQAGTGALRIDVAQHQLHAAILARRFGVDTAQQ